LGTANYVKGLPAKVWLIGGKQGVAEGSDDNRISFKIQKIQHLILLRSLRNKFDTQMCEITYQIVLQMTKLQIPLNKEVKMEDVQHFLYFLAQVEHVQREVLVPCL
jgi:hypothetical protein